MPLVTDGFRVTAVPMESPEDEVLDPVSTRRQDTIRRWGEICGYLSTTAPGRVQLTFIYDVANQECSKIFLKPLFPL
jgi:hypothetical protein